MGPDQIFSHRVPRTRRSTFHTAAIHATGRLVQVESLMALLLFVEVCSPVISLRQTILPRKGGGTEVPLCALLACLGLSVPPDRSFLTAFG